MRRLFIPGSFGAQSIASQRLVVEVEAAVDVDSVAQRPPFLGFHITENLFDRGNKIWTKEMGYSHNSFVLCPGILLITKWSSLLFLVPLTFSGFLALRDVMSLVCLLLVSWIFKLVKSGNARVFRSMPWSGFFRAPPVDGSLP